MPNGAIAGPDTRTSSSGWSEIASPATTSTISTSKEEIVVPWATDRPVQRMPAWTSPSGMIGSAADALAVPASAVTRAVATARRRSMWRATLAGAAHRLAGS
jgi:hypothetical protein